MAATRNQEESFTSSSSLPPRTYDVFLSFRGEDTRKNFTDHLFAALVRHGFSTFRDDEKLERGEDIGIELLKAIEESRISIIIFSRNYATSRWCLAELVKILECKNTFKQMVLPVFYDVDPADVRAQRGSFAEAFARHEERYKGGEMEGKVKGWRGALTEAANLSGWDLQNVADGHESKFIEKIVEDISNKLNLPYLNVANYTVGLESRVRHVNMMLSLGSDDVRMVGIWGVGGLGKTTIAKAIYNLLRREFEGSSFLANVRETSKQPNGLVGLQELLLSDILMNENQNIRNVDRGIEVIKHRLWCRRVLVVLDDVDDFEQLKALAIRRDWFHSGSRIIITTRDESFLRFVEVDAEYMPELLNDYESLQLFSWHAFRKDHPKEDYVELSREVLGYAGGLPLALEVLGSFLFDKTMPEWKSELEKLKVIPHDAIQEKLRISFDSLNDEEKDLFLDIAFFFVGMDKDFTIKILEGCGFFPEIGIGVLSRRCLVKFYLSTRFDRSKKLMMHDMLRDMGREIIRRKYLKEPGKRSRLWFHEDVLDVLTNHTGTEAVEGLVLNLPRSNDVQVKAQTFAKMNNIRLLKLTHVCLSGSYEHLSKRLSWLYWYGFPLKSIPSNLLMEKVVAIDMPYSSLKRVWKGRKILNKLKFLNLSHSYHLTETPDFSGCTSLEDLLLNNCTRLVEVHRSIECLNKLVVLGLKNCKNLRKLPLGMTSLQNLNITGCSKLEKLPGFKGSPSSSRFSLFSSRASLVRNPGSIRLSPASTHGLISLRRLCMENCNLSDFPDELGSLVSLEYLNLGRNNFCTLPASIIRLSRLDSLQLSHCTRLQSLPELPVNLTQLDARQCTSLERISIGSNSRKFSYYGFSCCYKLDVNNLASNFINSLLQSQEAVREFNDILIPGGEVPDSFNYGSVGSVLSFVVSLLPDRKIRGWILCVVIASSMIDDFEDKAGDNTLILYYGVKNKTKGTEIMKSKRLFQFLLYRQDHMWIEYVPQRCFEQPMDDGDEVEFSVFSKTDQYQVKKCGVELIYEEDEKEYPSNDQAMIQYGSPSYRDVILEDVSADQAVTDNQIMAIAGGAGSDDPTRRSASSTLKQGKPSRAEKGKAVAFESNERSPTSTRRRTGGIVIEDPKAPDVG